MGYATLIARTGQTVDVTRPVATGGKDAHGTPLVGVQTVASALPCLATEQPGREVLTPTGDRAIADWDIMLLPDAPEVRTSDTLTLHPGGRKLAVVSVVPATLGRVKPPYIVARSGGRP